ncbi:MAG: phosphatidate cytidylyltransferase, partial [Chlorobiaceae bacterium]
LIVPESVNVGKIVIIALIATVVEGVSPKEVDNLTIPIAVIAASRFL